MKPPHGVVDDLAGIFGALLCEMEVEHGGFQVGVPHVSLDNPGVDPGFQEMSGVAMPKSMYGNPALGDTGCGLGSSKSALNTVDRHRRK